MALLARGIERRALLAEKARSEGRAIKIHSLTVQGPPK